MFLKILRSKTNFVIFSHFYRFYVYEVIVTSHDFFLIFLVDIDRGDHDLLYIGTKYNIIGPLL